MRISLLQTGKTRDRFINEGVEIFNSRMKHYAPFSIETVPDLKNTRGLSMKEVQEKEADGILKRLKSEDYVILLDEKGKNYSSIAFAQHLNKLEGRVRNLVFIIGGPYGFSDRIYQRAGEKISLSSMTFSHQLVRLLFMEQMYRAFTILRGEPYHHE